MTTYIGREMSCSNQSDMMVVVLMLLLVGGAGLEMGLVALVMLLVNISMDDK